MAVIEQVCKNAEIDAEWLKENILEPYNQERNKENAAEEKKVKSILNKALKKIQ